MDGSGERVVNEGKGWNHSSPPRHWMWPFQENPSLSLFTVTWTCLTWAGMSLMISASHYSPTDSYQVQSLSDCAPSDTSWPWQVGWVTKSGRKVHWWRRMFADVTQQAVREGEVRAEGKELTTGTVIWGSLMVWHEDHLDHKKVCSTMY